MFFTVLALLKPLFSERSLRDKAEIGKESKNQLDHDSRFESVTQKSDS